MADTTDIAVHDRKAITVTVAERYGMEADAFEIALRNTVFLEGSRAEYAAFLVVCNEYKLNPLTKEIYAFKNKAGKIVPVVSIDGWVSLCNSHHAFDGLTFHDQHAEDGKLHSITCTIYRKDRSHPTEVTEYLAECRRATDPWKMEHRMLRHKSLIQCARYAFGFSGIYDEDEAQETVTVVREAPPALTAGFGDGGKPPRSPRKAKDAPASDQPGEPDEAAPASAEAAGDGEIAEDAEFEDVGERPTTPEADTETAGAPTAEPEPDTPASAEPASEDMQPAEEEPSPSSEDGEEEEEKTTATPGEVYLMAGDTFNAEGKRPTYKDGARFSSVGEKAAGKLTIHDFHAPIIAEIAEDSDEFPGDRPTAPTEDDADPFVPALARITEAPSYFAAKQVLKTLTATEPYAEATLERKTGIRLAIWKRYVDLCEAKVENGEVWADFTLMRMFLEFGATSPVHIDELWAKFWRHDAYKKASDGDKRAITDLNVRRKAELKEPE